MLEVNDITDMNFDIQRFIDARQGEYIICIFGGAFTQEGKQYDRPGYFSGIMYFNGYKKTFDENLKSVKSANHSMLLGISKMLDSINLQGKSVNILVTTSLGFLSAQNGSGANKDIVKEIIGKCKALNSKLLVYQWYSGAEQLRSHINSEILKD